VPLEVLLYVALDCCDAAHWHCSGAGASGTTTENHEAYVVHVGVTQHKVYPWMTCCRREA
jgi:hypothetical protein